MAVTFRGVNSPLIYLGLKLIRASNPCVTYKRVDWDLYAYVITIIIDNTCYQRKRAHKENLERK